MTGKGEDCLTERHLSLFGAIIRWFARYEQLILRLTAAVAGSDASATMILTRKLDFNDKKLALLDLLRHRATPLDQYDRISNFLTIPGTFLRLRHDIAHSPWTSAPTPYSVQPVWIFHRQPGVKPLHGDPDNIKARYVEGNEDKLDYSLDELEGITETLAANYANFSAYVDETFPSAGKN